MNNKIPHFILKKNLQKSSQTHKYFSDIIDEGILRDICKRVTNVDKFTVDYVDNDYKDDILTPTYNQGRLIILKYNNSIKYISVSEENIGGRNSSVQSVPTAFNLFYMNNYKNKELYYYFICKKGNYKTDYHVFIYRLMATIGFKFLNLDQIELEITPFSSIDDLILTRRINSLKKRANNSSYITKNENSELEIYGKTYGANKYETSLICYAVSILTKSNKPIVLYEILDNNLKELPQPSLSVIKKMGKINKIIPVSKSLNKLSPENKNKLRSPRYIFNLFERLGNKHCALCTCSIPEIIQAAHIWEISAIKKDRSLSDKDKFIHAISGDNGIWLCANHHKLFDEQIIKISIDGKVEFNTSQLEYINFLKEITLIDKLPKEYMSNNFINYLQKRNSKNPSCPNSPK